MERQREEVDMQGKLQSYMIQTNSDPFCLASQEMHICAAKSCQNYPKKKTYSKAAIVNVRKNKNKHFGGDTKSAHKELK